MLFARLDQGLAPLLCVFEVILIDIMRCTGQRTFITKRSSVEFWRPEFGVRGTRMAFAKQMGRISLQFPYILRKYTLRLSSDDQMHMGRQYIEGRDCDMMSFRRIQDCLSDTDLFLRSQDDRVASSDFVFLHPLGDSGVVCNECKQP